MKMNYFIKCLPLIHFEYLRNIEKKNSSISKSQKKVTNIKKTENYNV